MLTNKVSNKYIKFGIMAAITFALLWVFPRFWPLISPFVVAFIIAMPAQRLVSFLERKLKINRSIGSIFVVLLIISVIGGILAYLIFQLTMEIQVIVENLPGTIDQFRYQLDNVSDRYTAFADNLPPEIAGFFDNLLNELQENLPTFLASAVEGATPAVLGFAGNLTAVIFYIFILILSTFFIIKDYDNVVGFFRRQMSAETAEKLSRIKKAMSAGFANFMKAQGILMCITFVIVSVTLLISRTQHALVAAFFIALVDFVPVLGTGAVLIPWAVISLVYGDITMAIVLIVLQVVCFLTRNLLQPKILSSQIGLHPLLTLMGLFIGLHLFGIAGFVFGPIMALLGVSLYNAVKNDNHPPQT